MPHTDNETLLAFFQGEGLGNVFKSLDLNSLNLILKRTAVSKQTKLLAIERYLQVPADVRVVKDDEQFFNLISHTGFFSDKYEKTSTAIGRVTNDVGILLLSLVKSQQLYSDFMPGELPESLESAFSDYRFVFLLL